MMRHGAAVGQCVFSSNSLFGLMCVFGSSVRMQVCFLLLLIQLHVTEGCRLKGTSGLRSITAYTGGSVLLPCFCTDLHTTHQTFTWAKHTNERKWVEISPESEQYRDKFQLVNDHSSGNLSLLISHLTVEDEGVYMCSVKWGEHIEVRLTVEGCTLNQETESVTLTGHVGQSVLLPCSCSRLQAKPHTLRWIFHKGSNEKEIFPNDQTNRYTDRIQLFNDHHPGNLSLLISHLTVEDGGDYTCEISNNYDFNDISVRVKEAPKGRSSSTRNIKPNFTPGPHTTTTTTSIIIIIIIVIIISSAVVVVLLLPILGVIYCKRRGQRRGQTETSGGQTGPRTQQKEQNESDVLYTCINHNKPEEKDGVTYSTVIYNNIARAPHTPVASDDSTVYASIITN